MRVNSISSVCFKQNNEKSKPVLNRYNLVPATGYTAIGLGIASGALAYNKKPKAHKTTAFLALASAIGHVALIKRNQTNVGF